VCVRLSTLNSASPAGLTCAKIRQHIQISGKSGEEADRHRVRIEAQETIDDFKTSRILRGKYKE